MKSGTCKSMGGTKAPTKGTAETAGGFKKGAHNAGISSTVKGFGAGFTKSG